MDMQEATWMAQDPHAPPPQEMLSAIANALIWVLILALVVPLGSAVAATALRRKIAALGFTAAFTIPALILLLLMPPTQPRPPPRPPFFARPPPTPPPPRTPPHHPPHRPHGPSCTP